MVVGVGGLSTMLLLELFYGCWRIPYVCADSTIPWLLVLEDSLQCCCCLSYSMLVGVGGLSTLCCLRCLAMFVDFVHYTLL